MAELDTFNSFMMTPQGTQFSLSYHAVPYHEAIMQISWHGIYYSQISGLLLSSPLPYRESSCLMVQPNVYIAQKIIIYNTMITKKCHQSLQYIFLQKLQQVFELAAAWYTYAFAHDGVSYTPAQCLINIQLHLSCQVLRADIGLHFFAIAKSESRRKKSNNKNQKLSLLVNIILKN